MRYIEREKLDNFVEVIRMISKDKRRVSVILPLSVVEKIDGLASKSGMSRSQMVAWLTVQGVESYEAVMKLPMETLNKLKEAL